MEKAMAPHSSTLAWKTPWTEEPGRLQSMRSLRVGHDWTTSLSLFTSMHWRRKWKRTPVFLPGESRGGGTWWAAVYGVSQSRTWLKRLSSSSSNCPWIAPLQSLPPSERGLWGSKPTHKCPVKKMLTCHSRLTKVARSAVIFFLTLHRCFGISPPISTPAALQLGYGWIHTDHWDCESRPFQIPEAIIMWHVINKSFCNSEVVLQSNFLPCLNKISTSWYFSF